MKPKLIILLTGFLFACKNENSVTISENTFIYKSKIYKLVDNELTEIASLTSDSIRTLSVLKPKKRQFNTVDLNYVKNGAKAHVDALYRGNILYFKITITGLNDLQENYSSGQFTIEFRDEFNFNLNTIDIPVRHLTGIVDENNEIIYYQCEGKLEMSTEINTAIQTISISSSVKRSAY